LTTEETPSIDTDSIAGSGPLLVDALLAGELASRLVGWYLFPAKVEGTNKRPLTPSWQSYAATGKEAVESLWNRFGEYNEDGTLTPTAVGVACDPSGIFVIDEDREWRSEEASPGTDWQAWATALDSCNSLILSSSLRGMPHYYFRQPDDGKGRVAERVWHGGEVKSKGYIILSASDPVHQPSHAGGGLWTTADVADAVLPLIDLIGRRRNFNNSDLPSGTGTYSHRVTKEEFADWLDQEPGEHFGGRLIAEEYEGSFIDQLVDKLRRSVGNGTSRRGSCLNTIHTAVIESYQGLYSLEAAYYAIEDAYEELRTYGPGDTKGDKGWNQRRADDYRSMWETEITKPDAMQSSEASYDDLLARLNTSGFNLEITEADREEDAWCMSIIFAAGENASPSVDLVLPAPELDLSFDIKAEPVDDGLSWDEAGVPDSHPAKPAPPAPIVAPVMLGQDAKRGVLWDLASGLIGKHELPHEALMIVMAGWSGSVLGSVGAGAMFVTEDRHGPELCVCMVGTSAISHKSGTVAFGHMVFLEWIDAMETGVGAPGQCSGFIREVSGIESGQAFIEIWPNAADVAGGAGIGRAVMMVEKELTTMWKKASRKGSTIPEEIRKAWDGDMLAVRGVRAGNHRVQPKNYRFSAVGATIHTLAARAIVESDAHISGDGNRWLWCWGQEVPKPVKGTPSFSDHVLVESIRNQVRGLIRSVETARNQGWWPGSAIGPGGVPITEFGEPKLWWTAEADQTWLGDNGTLLEGKGIYADLSYEIGANSTGSAVVTSLKGRGAQQVMRLAIGYEMLKAGEGWADIVRRTLQPDGRAWCISLEAQNWANAVWRFCADTVDHLFANATGDEKVDELVLAIREIARDQGKKFNNFVFKSDIVGNGFSKNSISALLAKAEEQGAIWSGTLRKDRPGAPPVVVGLPKWVPPPEITKRSLRITR
jgi:hypothetical protein